MITAIIVFGSLTLLFGILLLLNEIPFTRDLFVDTICRITNQESDNIVIYNCVYKALKNQLRTVAVIMLMITAILGFIASGVTEPYPEIPMFHEVPDSLVMRYR